MEEIIKQLEIDIYDCKLDAGDSGNNEEMINEAIKTLEKLEQALSLLDVSQQRELLITFARWWIFIEKPITASYSNIVDKYLKSNL